MQLPATFLLVVFKISRSDSVPTLWLSLACLQDDAFSRPRTFLCRLLAPSGHADPSDWCLLAGDFVAKVENRATRKISRKLIFGLLRSCVAFQRHRGGP